MSATGVARGVIALAAAGLLLLTGQAPAPASDDAHKMAEKFSTTSDGAAKAKKAEADRKAAEAKKRDKEKAEAAKQEADRKAEDARKRAAEKAAEVRKREAQRRTEALRKEAADQMAAENARRAAEQRQADEAEMLARAKREADEMQTATEQARLAQEARRLIEAAETERAKAEAVLKGENDEQRTRVAEEERLANQRSEEARALVEKLKRVRQIRDARLAAQARREQAPEPMPEPVATAPPAPAESEPATRAAEPPRTATAAAPEPSPQPPASTASRSPIATQAGGKPELATSTASLEPSAASASAPPVQTPPPAVAATPPAATPPVPPAAAYSGREAKQPDAPAQLPATEQPRRLSETRVTVLLILEPGSYGIRRKWPRTADPILCVPEGCYISDGPDEPAYFMPGRRVFGFGNTFRARAGACSQSLGCVFRGVELGSLPAYLQPVDLHILKHDRRTSQAILTDSGCNTDAGRLACSHGINTGDYTMWILPESLAAQAGPDALERAVADGLRGPRSAELTPR